MKTHKLGSPGKSQYEVEFHPAAEREFNALPETMKDRFERGIDRLEEDPRTKRPGADIEKMTDGEGLYRLRVGEYRAIYEIDDQGRIVLILLFDERGRGYKRLTKIAQARRIG